MGSNATATASSGGIGVLLLTITFVLLKSFKIIDWSWWWVFSPLWISSILAIVFVGGFLGLAWWASKK